MKIIGSAGGLLLNKSEKMSRILVTGGAGFIGSHLSRRLVNEGNEVICVDNLFTGNKANIRDLMGNPDFEFIRHDIITPIHLEIDKIYNLACPASPLRYQYNPIDTIKTSILGTMNMLGLAEQVDARMLQASTSEVYGDPDSSHHPQNESYWGNVNPIGIRSCYDEGKRAAETLCFDYHRQNGVDIKVMRIFNTYGPNMSLNDGRVVSNFIVRAIKDDDMTIYGDGKQTRCFCHVDDLVDGMIRLMESDKGFTGHCNVGNPNELTILELAKKIIKLTDSKSKITFAPLPQDDPKQRKPDISLAKEKLGWKPESRLKTGL
jgi:UDP-glucuronate decarboxylase